MDHITPSTYTGSTLYRPTTAPFLCEALSDMLNRLPIELLFWICESLEKSDLINLILLSRSIKAIFSKALYQRLHDDIMPILYRSVLKRRLDVAYNLLTQCKADVNSDYRGTITLRLAIEMRYPEAVALLL
jgi:hypothetical protein